MSNEVHFRALVLLVLLVMKAIRYRTLRRCVGQTTVDTTFSNRMDRMLLHMVGVLGTASIGIFVFLPRSIRWADASAPDWLRWLGFGVCIVSLLLLAWSDHHLGVNFSATLRIRQQHCIVDTGPYHWVRHPIYTSGLLFLIGVSLLTSNYLVAIGWSGLVPLYVLRIPKEEAMMIRTFGDAYRAYIARTGLLLPKFGGTAKRDQSNAG